MRVSNISQAKDLLEQHGQRQILAFCDELNDQQQGQLVSQINKLDFNNLDKWINELVLNTPLADIPDDFKPAPYYKATPQENEQKALYDKALKLGRELISGGKVAAFVVAGGQGTRLGFDGPKGNYPVSPVKNKTLFQLFAEQIKANSNRYGVDLAWYIMTSPLNDAQTKEIFKENDYFGLGEDNVFIFQQGTMPNFGFDGKILMADKDKIACSPDGHGGSLKALFDSGAIDHMKARGVEYASYYQVDNPLINIFDPLFVGLHALAEAQMSSKTLIKAYPKEKVGNFCIVDGKMTVIEYSDLPDEHAERKNPDGSLVFELGSIAIHMVSRSFVEKINEKGFALPWHRAEKKIPYIDAQGNKVKPTKPNGVKLESFVFDALPMTTSSIILETLRENEFGPVKNATGIDSAESSRELMIACWAGWLEDAGVKVPRKADGSVDAVIEIAAGFALDADELKSKVNEIPEIKAGDSVYLG